MDVGPLPPHPPLGGLIRPFETPVDGTKFNVPESERTLPLTADFKKNLALRGLVAVDLVYPFVFSSNTLSLQYLLSSVIGTKYVGIGIRYSDAHLSSKENKDGVEAYSYVLDENAFVAFLNRTLACAAEGMKRVDSPRRRLRLLTGNVLVLLLKLRRMQQRASDLDVFAEFPLLTLRSGLSHLLFGLWEELWAVGYQMASSDAAACSDAALTRACAAFFYYTEAAKSELLRGHLGQTIENAKQRVVAVLIGWITSRIERSREAPATISDIPWDRAGTTMTAGKYRSTVFAALGVIAKKGRELPPPAPRYAAAYSMAADQCRANLLTSVKGAVLGTAQNVDPIAQALQIGADWAADRPRPLFQSAAHPEALSAQGLWAWKSETSACPRGLEQLFEEGTKRYTDV